MREESDAVAAWAGLDVSKESFDAALYLPVKPGAPPRDHRQIPIKKFPRTQKGVKSFARWSNRLVDKNCTENTPPPVRCVMEATGRYSRELAAWLVDVDAGYRPAIEDPKTMKDFRGSLKLRDKTDPSDAVAIARYGAERMPAPPSDLPAHYLELRELSRERDHICNALTSAHIRLQELPAGAARVIHEKMMSSMKEALDDIERRIKDHVRSHKDIRRAVERLISIPGVGFVTAIVVLAECGPLSRFSRSRKLTSYAGLAPVLVKSGTSVHGQTHISKRGPSRVRQVLYMASIAACGTQPDLEDFRFRLIRNGKPPLSARCATMRKLLTIMRAVVVNDTDFVHDYGTDKQTREKLEKFAMSA